MRLATVLASIALALTLIPRSAQASPSKTIGILVFDGFLTSDVTAPVEVFGAATKKSWFASYSVVVISTTHNKVVHSEEGLAVVAENTIYDDNLKLDVLLVPSSYHMDTVVKDPNVVAFIRKQRQSASWVGSNCSGALLLGEAGVLDGKKATTWAGGEKGLAKSYPKVDVQFDQNVVVDGNVITSNGGPVSYQAAFELLARLSSEDFAKEIRQTIQFDRLKTAFAK